MRITGRRLMMKNEKRKFSIEEAGEGEDEEGGGGGGVSQLKRIARTLLLSSPLLKPPSVSRIRMLCKPSVQLIKR